MKQERSFLQQGTLFFKGLIMGAANKVPGVSGGTVSFVFGFYEELIFSFKKINLKAFQLLFKGRFREFYQHVNGQFLLLIMDYFQDILILLMVN